MNGSLVICTRNRAAQLVESLSRLARLRYPAGWQLVLIDNGSADETQAAIQRFRGSFAGSVRACIERKPGIARARNRGWQESRGELVVFTDDDCYPDPGFLEAVVRCFEEDSGLGFVGGRILLYDHTDY